MNVSGQMISLLTWIFWICLLLLFYSYAGYGLLLAMLVRLKRLFGGKPAVPAEPSEWPAVAMIVAAYNEEEYIEEKIRNTAGLDYPADKLELLIVADGSTDRTAELAGLHPGVTVLHDPVRRGKASALRRGVAASGAPVLVFSDANSLLNPEALRLLVRHLSNPAIGGVAGEKKVTAATESVGSGEGLYWRYESILKALDAELHSAMGAAGELFCLRRELFVPVPDQTLIEDFVLSLQVCLKGKKLAYEPGAYALETPSASLREEMKRRVRISAGAFQAMGLLKPLFNPIRHPLLAFQFISHRILRWTLCPPALLLLFLSNMLLWASTASSFFAITGLLQILFYILGFVGLVREKQVGYIKLIYIPAYFLVLNGSVCVGFFRYLRGRQPVLWEKAARLK